MLCLNYTNCTSTTIGEQGIESDLLAPNTPLDDRARQITAQLNRSRGTGPERWRSLADDPLRTAHLDAMQPLLDRCNGQFDTILVLGIGGSALGLASLQHALTPLMTRSLPLDAAPAPRLFVLDNVDPALLQGAINVVENTTGWERTLVIAISKSGETAETAAQFLLLRQRLIESLGDAHNKNIIAITDPDSGTLRSLCQTHNYATLPVPQGVGGRFSVLSPVGLFPAALLGIDINALLDGARDMDTRCQNESLTRNPAAMLATLLVHFGAHNKPNHVLMPYSNRLSLMADWYCQLWAESLGKNTDLDGNAITTGFTPIKALGATDQHSQVQLYRQGPNDKVFGFLRVKDHAPLDLTIPPGNNIESLSYLENATLGTLLNAEHNATAYALTKSQRPNYTIEFPTVDAFHIGAFFQLWQIATAYAGSMLHINPYDQPAVETAKQATFGLMGKPGYEQHKLDVESLRNLTQHIVE
jgi:glucose-6-phosphate isomerase